MRSDNENTEFLKQIYKNSQMGCLTLEKIVDMTDDEAYRDLLQKQLDGYKEIFHKTEAVLDEKDRPAKGVTAAQEFSTKMMINMNTLSDKSPSHLSEMLIQGSTMGIIDMTKGLQNCNSLTAETRDLGSKLLKSEENYVESLKKFL